MSANVLQEPVSKFIEELLPVLQHIAKGLPGIDEKKLPVDVAQEAYNLCAAFIDADGRETDAELWAFLNAFAGRFDSLLHLATPDKAREAGLVSGKKAWLGTPSLLFDILVHTDKAKGTRWSWNYYEKAMFLGHLVCATDAVPSQAELSALDRFRTMLLKTMDRAGVPRPGSKNAGTPAEGEVATSSELPPETELPEAKLEPARPLEELLEELDALVGLDAVKSEVRLVANLIKVQNLRKERGLPVVESSRHVVFTGNPGTGKTTVARLLAQIYRTLGALEKGQLVETDRSGLVAGYVGQTAIKVREVFDSAIGGMLLIDEAYALARGNENDFGREAIDTLVKLMEDHREEVAVVAAGYPEEMHIFVESNPGLRSRFPKTIHFPDYTTDELVAIFKSMTEKNGYKLPPATEEQLSQLLDSFPRDKGFGNARLARNLFEAALAHHATRVVEIKDPTNDHLATFEPEDIR